MSRIRSIHPGLWTDDGFMALTPLARLLAIGLWNEAYDDGVFVWKPLTLKARIFPADAVDVPALLEELLAGNFIKKTSHDDRPIGLIRNFRVYQRPKKPNSSGMLSELDAEYVGLVPHQFPTGSENSPQMEEGGGRGEEEKDDNEPRAPLLDPAPALFDEVWLAFPRNPTSSEARARQQFETLGPQEQRALLPAAKDFSSWFEKDREARQRSPEDAQRFAPHLSTWIATGQWKEPPPGTGREPRADLVVLTAGDPDFVAVEALRGRKLFVGSPLGRVTLERTEVERARRHALTEAGDGAR
ncbi:hypothetical protein [Devosia sp.]|uniref:hypothetical protein n=1 Tax=Devosia sp. TaxID=1871048 RepID=UPI0035ADF386